MFPSLAAFRFIPLAGGLAVPPILGLAAYGLDRLLAANWPRLGLSFQTSQGEHKRIISLKWLLLIPLVWNLHTTYDFSRNWLYVTRISEGVYTLLQALRTPNLQWVEPPSVNTGISSRPCAWGSNLAPAS